MVNMLLTTTDKRDLTKKYHFDTVVERYTDNVLATGTKPKTVRVYGTHLEAVRSIVEAYDEGMILDIRDIDIETCEVVRKQLQVGHAISTANAMMKTFRRYLEYARKRKLIVENPMADISPIKNKQRDVKYVPTAAEIAKIKRVMYKNISTVERLKYCLAIELMLVTANRITENLSITWSDIDAKNLVLNLPAEITKSGKDHMKFLTDEIIEKLDVLKKYGDSEYVFSTRNNTPIHRNHMERWFKAVLDDANIDTPITFHALRRYVITDAIERGVNIAYVSKYLANHSSIAITLDHYCKPDVEHAEADIRSKLFS